MRGQEHCGLNSLVVHIING